MARKTNTPAGNQNLERRVDQATRSVKRRRGARHATVPKVGQLEHNVDAILRSRGLELNAPIDKVLGKSKRRGKFVPFTSKSARRAAKVRPARGKQLRAPRKSR